MTLAEALQEEHFGGSLSSSSSGLTTVCLELLRAGCDETAANGGGGEGGDASSSWVSDLGASLMAQVRLFPFLFSFPFRSVPASFPFPFPSLLPRSPFLSLLFFLSLFPSLLFLLPSLSAGDGLKKL